MNNEIDEKNAMTDDEQQIVYSPEEMLYLDALEIYNKALTGKRVNANQLNAANSFLTTHIATGLFIQRQDEHLGINRDDDGTSFEDY